MALVAILALWSSPAPATVVRSVTIEELASSAELVLRGRVIELDSRMVDEGRRIATRVTVSVNEAYKGVPAESIEILLPGGTHGDLVQSVQGLPEFTVGEEVVLFLEQHPGSTLGPPRRYTLISMGLGAFFVKEGEAVRRTHGLEVITGPLDRPREIPFDERVMPLTRLEERIRSALRERIP